jgi:hypothetical protein
MVKGRERIAHLHNMKTIFKESCSFKEGDEYPDLISYICETIGYRYTEDDPCDPLSGVLLLSKNIKITIEVYEP